MKELNLAAIRAPRDLSGRWEILMRKLTLFCTVLIVLALIPELTALGQVRLKLSVTAKPSVIPLSGDWKLGSLEMDEGERQGAFQPGFDDRTFRTVTVPGEVQQQIGLHDMDLYYQSKTLTLVNKKEWWYRKQFGVNQSERAKFLRLTFDGVDYFASVWLNGKKLGEHEGGYVSFFYDVTSMIQFGGVNVLAVKVTSPWIPRGRGFLEYMKGDWTTIDPQNRMHINQPPFFFGPYWDGIPADGNAAFPMGIC